MQNDLVNNNGHLYFISHLAAGPLLDGVPQVPPQGARLLAPGDYIWLCMKTAKGDYHRRGAPVINVPYATAEGESPPGLTRHAGDCIPFDQRVQAAFVLCMIMDGHRLGQHCCLQQSLHITIATHLHDPCPKLRFWQCLCLFKVRRRRGLGWACTARGLLPHHGRVWPMLRQLWENFEDARVPALMERLPDTLVPMLLTDASPEVRAGAAVALGALLRGDDPYVAPSRSVICAGTRVSHTPLAARCASSDADDVDFEYGVFAPPVVAPRGPQREQPEGFVSAAWMLAMQAASKAAPRHGFTHSHSRRPRVQSDLGAAVATPRGPLSDGRAPAAAAAGDGATPPVSGAGAQAATPAAPLSPEQGPSTPREPSPFDAINLPGRRVSRAMMELALCVCAVPACQDASPLVRRCDRSRQHVLLAYFLTLLDPVSVCLCVCVLRLCVCVTPLTARCCSHSHGWLFTPAMRQPCESSRLRPSCTVNLALRRRRTKATPRRRTTRRVWTRTARMYVAVWGVSVPCRSAAHAPCHPTPITRVLPNV